MPRQKTHEHCLNTIRSNRNHKLPCRNHQGWDHLATVVLVFVPVMEHYGVSQNKNKRLKKLYLVMIKDGTFGVRACRNMIRAIRERSAFFKLQKKSRKGRVQNLFSHASKPGKSLDKIPVDKNITLRVDLLKKEYVHHDQ